MKADKFIEFVKRHTEFTEFSASLLNKFVEKVIVHEATRNNGVREQEVEIYLNFIGRFDLPEQEEPQEETAPRNNRRTTGSFAGAGQGTLCEESSRQEGRRGSTEPSTLADYIQGILPRKEQAGKSHITQSIYNLKDAANMLNFLQQNSWRDLMKNSGL